MSSLRILISLDGSAEPRIWSPQDQPPTPHKNLNYAKGLYFFDIISYILNPIEGGVGWTRMPSPSSTPTPTPPTTLRGF